MAGYLPAERHSVALTRLSAISWHFSVSAISWHLSDTLKDIKEPVEQPWQFVSDVSGQVRYGRMVLEVLVVTLVGVCLTFCAGLMRGTEKRVVTL